MTGLYWKKCALHIHSPKSFDFKGDKSISPQIFLDKLIENNVDVIAITDHSSFEYIKILNEVNEANDNPIVIFPGTEIHTNDGIHLLVLFERNTNIENMQHFLNNINIKQEQFGTDLKCDRVIEGCEILNKISENNALPIFAHVESDKGLFKQFQGNQIKEEIIKQKNYIFECRRAKLDDVKNYDGLAFIIKSDFHSEENFLMKVNILG